MPLSEFQRSTTKGRPESNQSKINNFSSDVSSFMPDNDFVELLWENGQVVMQGQSNRPKKSTFPTPFPSLKVQEKESRDDGTIPKIGLFEAMDSTVNDLSLSVPVPSANMDMHAQDDDMAPWINYSVEDSLCLEFFSELSGVNPNSLPNDRNNGLSVKDFHNVEHGYSNKGFREGQEPIRTRTNQFFQSPQQCQTSSPNIKPKVADLSVGGRNSINPQGQFQKQELVSSSKPSQLSGGVGLVNFSHFSRPVAPTKAIIEDKDRWKSTKEASSAAASNKPVESILIESTGVQGNSAMALTNKELRSNVKPHYVPVEEPEVLVQDGTSRNNQHCIGTATDVNHNNSVSMAFGSHEAEKGPEPVVASSVCSGSSAGPRPNDPKHREKRKNREGDESGYQSEDLDDDSIGVKKRTTTRAGTSTKRSRAAEVHNLSERRRRDRINEKMRALQELIPNCNKVDKASMLDEAIEYLKTLQLQVQMMSMGTGLCMPPLMLPPGMQHIRSPAMAHFAPMGLGMGMGMGYGMGMLDMNGSPGCPLFPVPPMHPPQYPCTSIPGATGLQLFGIPGHGHGLPVSMPRPQLFSPLQGLASKGNGTNEVSGMMMHPVPVSEAGPSSRCKDQQQQEQSMNVEEMQKANTNESQVAKESLERPNLVQLSNQALHNSGGEAVNSISDSGNASSRSNLCMQLKHVD